MKKLPLNFYLQVGLCAALWGSAFPVIKLSYAHLGFESYGEKLLFAGTRFILAGLLVMGICRRNVWQSYWDAPKGQLYGVVLGQTFGQYVFFYYGLSVSSGALGSLLNGWGSIVWVLLAPLFLKSAYPSGRQWVALAFCVVGISIAVYAPGVGSGNVPMGVVAFFLVGVSGALGAIAMKRIAPEFGSRTVTALSLFIGGLMLTVAGIYQWESFVHEYTLATLWVTIYLSALSAIAFTLWNRLIEHYSVNALSAYRFLIPLFGVVESAIFLKDESVGVGIVVGGLILFVSLYAMSRLEEKRASG